MIKLGMPGGLGAPEILIVILIIIFFIAMPALWLSERSKRKIWQKKAEEFQKKIFELTDRK